MKNEIIFIVEEASAGGYVARALGHSIFSESDTFEAIKEEIKDAARCHFPLSKVFLYRKKLTDMRLIKLL